MANMWFVYFRMRVLAFFIGVVGARVTSLESSTTEASHDSESLGKSRMIQRKFSGHNISLQRATLTDDSVDDYSSLTSSRNNTGTDSLYIHVKDNFGGFLYNSTILIIALIGIFGNSLGVLFLLHRRMKQSFQIFLTSLMGIDVLYLVFTVIQSLLAISTYFDHSLLYTFRCFVSERLRMLQIICYNTSAFIITCMSFERLINIRFPFRVMKHIKFRHYAIITTISGFLFNIALLIPVFIFQESPKLLENRTSCPQFIFRWKQDAVFKAQKYCTVGRFIGAIYARDYYIYGQ